MRIFSNRVFILAGASLIATAATAQEVAQNEEGMDDLIIVTASKRAATLQDTPISVAVASQKQIQEAQIRDVLDLQTLVPSLRVSQLQNSSNTSFIIRGFGNGANNIGIEPAVGVFIDGVYRSRSSAQIGDLPNVQRVEVLRGPQSTLFGKNASAGIISIITAEPQFDLGGGAEISYGNFNAIVARADITGPISDTVAVSLAGGINKRDGYGRNLELGTDFSDRDRWNVRGQLLFKPSDDFKIRLIGEYNKIDESCCVVANVVLSPTLNGVINLAGGQINPDTFSNEIFANYDPTNIVEDYGFSGQADWRAGDLDITFIGSYRRNSNETDTDSDFTSAEILQKVAAQTNIRTYTAEARVASNFDGPLNFLLGAFYFHEDLTLDTQTELGADFRGFANILSQGGYLNAEALLQPLTGLPVGSFGAAGTGTLEEYSLRNRAISVFGQVDYELTERLTLTGGFNYTRDRKRGTADVVTTEPFGQLDLVAIGAGLLAQNGVPPALIPGLADTAANPLLPLQALQFIFPFINVPNVVEDGRTADNDLAYNVRAAYKFTDNISGYVTYATGFKASSFNLSRDAAPLPRDYIPGSPITNPAPSAIRTAGLAAPNTRTGTRFAGPEEASVYELGLKGQFDTFAFNFAVFQQAIENFQGSIFNGTGFILQNAPKQSTFGLELDTSFTPIRALNLTASLTYLNPKFDSFPDASAFGPDLTVVQADLTGLRPAGIPEFALAVGGTYTASLTDKVNAIFHADFTHESKVAVAQGLSVANITREVNLLNASVTLALDNGLEVSIWGRNLTDSRFLAAIFPGVAQPGNINGYPSLPRTYGGLVRYRF